MKRLIPKKYDHYYRLPDQKFDFIIPRLTDCFGTDERKDIIFVGSFRGPSRKGKEWEGVIKELVGKSQSGEPAFIGRESETDEAQLPEPDDIFRGNNIGRVRFAFSLLFSMPIIYRVRCKEEGTMTERNAKQT